MIDRKEVLNEYTRWIHKTCEEGDTKTQFTPKGIVNIVCDTVEKQVKKFNISGVSHRRELLLDFWMKLPKTHKHKGVAEHYIDNYLKSLNYE